MPTEISESELASMDTEKLLALQAAVEARLAQERERFMAQAQALGLACTANGASKPRKRRAQHRDE